MPPQNQRPGKRAGEGAVLVLALVWFAVLGNRGLNLTDEGWYLLRGFELTLGKITYRDYYSHLTPLGFMIQAALIKIFGLHILVGRIYVLLQGLIVVAISLGIGRRHLAYPYSLVPAVIIIFYSVSLGGFPNYNIDSPFFLFVALALLDRYLKRPRAAGPFIAGLLVSASVCTRQTSLLPGLAMILTALHLVRDQTSFRERTGHAAAAMLGFTIPALVVAAFLAYHHALQEAWQCLVGIGGQKDFHFYVVLPRAGFLFSAGLALVYVLIRVGRRWPKAEAVTWWFAGSASALLIFLVSWEISGPLLCAVAVASLIAFVHPREKDKTWTLIRVFGVGYFLITILAGVDLGHLLMVTSLGAFFVGLLLQNLGQHKDTDYRRSRYRAAVVGLALILLTGIWLDLSLPHLRFSQGPRWRDTAKVDLPGLEGMRFPADQARALEKTVNYIKEHTRPDEEIFVYPWDEMIHLLSGRLSATYHTYFHYEIFNQPFLRRTLSDLEQKRPRIIVVRMKGDQIFHIAFQGEASAMTAYLEAHYRNAVRYGDFMIMERTD